MGKRAVILAGGRGTRLRPYTVVLPKPLMPIGEYPILEVIVRQLAYYEFKHITMAVNHQVDIIKAFFGNGSRWGVDIDYSFEYKNLSTIGPLRIIDNLPENFLLMNGDILTDLDFDIDNLTKHIRLRIVWQTLPEKRTKETERQVIDYVKGYCNKENIATITHKNEFIEEDVIDDIEETELDLDNISIQEVQHQIFNDYKS